MLVSYGSSKTHNNSLCSKAYIREQENNKCLIFHLIIIKSNQICPPQMKSAAAIMSGLTPPCYATFSSHRCFRFLSRSFPIYPSLNKPPIHLNPIRNSSSSSYSISAKPSSQIRKNKNGSGLEQDQKLTALRDLFGKPGINIDAYIVPSQDAHQVLFFFIYNYDL